MTRSLAIAALLCGCLTEPLPPEPVPDQRAINVAIEAWDEAGLPYAELCSDTRGKLVIDIRADVMAVCGEDMAGIVIGCFVAPVSDASPILIATDDPYRRADTVVHEAMHWLSWCAIGDKDGEHLNYEVWQVVYWDALSRVTP